MSLDSVEEVQIVKGVLPAEYGGVAGGQVNMISRLRHERVPRNGVLQPAEPSSGTRAAFFRRPPNPSAPSISTGSTLGGPIFRNNLFFFTTYEGYRENVQIDLVGNTPNQGTRDALLAALPFREKNLARRVPGPD